jgi:membrane-bound ClpP family serine protease
VVHPLLGLALLIASYLHPLAIRGLGAFLLIVGAIALTDTPWNPGWSLVGILVLWAAVNVVRITRDGGDTVDVRSDRSDRSEERMPLTSAR